MDLAMLTRSSSARPCSLVEKSAVWREVKVVSAAFLAYDMYAPLSFMRAPQHDHKQRFCRFNHNHVQYCPTPSCLSIVYITYEEQLDQRICAHLSGSVDSRKLGIASIVAGSGLTGDV
jgi:hypothetical protein